MNKDLYSKSLKFPGIYRARVLSNLDPSKLGRVKAQVYPMLSEIIDPELLPWCVPATPVFCGAGSNTGTFGIPTIDSAIFVFFENGDIYQPVYFAEAPNGVFGLPGNMNLHYPNTRGFTTPGGFSVLFDDEGMLFQVRHPSGTVIVMDAEGTLYVTSAKNININASGPVVLTTSGAVTVNAPTVTLNAEGSVYLNAPTVNASGNLEVGTGDSGEFTTADGRTVTVIKGIVMGITA